MEIYVNDKKMHFSLENEKTLGDILKAVERDCEKSNATIISITVNDTLLSDETFEKAFIQPLDSIQKIGLQTVSEDDVLFMLRNIVAVGDEISEKMQNIPVLLQGNKDIEVSHIVTSFVDCFNTICHIMGLCVLFPDKFSSLKIGDQNFSEFLNDFTPILQDFESSLTNKDTVLTGDLAEYEIVPRLQLFSESVRRTFKS